MKLLRTLLASVLAWALLAAPAPAALAIISGTGTGGALAGANTNANQATVTATLTASVPSGSLVIVGCMYRGTGSSVTSVTDSQSNTYSAGQAGVNTPGTTNRIFYAYTTHALTTSDTITCTFGNTTTNIKFINSVAFSGAASSPYDSSGSATPTTGTTSLSPTATTNTLSQSNEVVVGLVASLAGTVSLEGGTGTWTSLGSITNTSSLHMAYQIVSSTTALTYSPTLSTLTSWIEFLQGFKEVSATPSVCLMSLMGVGSC